MELTDERLREIKIDWLNLGALNDEDKEWAQEMVTAIDMALAANAAKRQEPVATVAEVYESRYTLEWNGQAHPEGTKLYAGPQNTELSPTAKPVAWMVWSPMRGPARFSTDPRTPIEAAYRGDYTCDALYAAPPDLAAKLAEARELLESVVKDTTIDLDVWNKCNNFLARTK